MSVYSNAFCASECPHKSVCLVIPSQINLIGPFMIPTDEPKIIALRFWFLRTKIKQWLLNFFNLSNWKQYFWIFENICRGIAIGERRAIYTYFTYLTWQAITYQTCLIRLKTKILTYKNLSTVLIIPSSISWSEIPYFVLASLDLNPVTFLFAGKSQRVRWKSVTRSRMYRNLTVGNFFTMLSSAAQWRKVELQNFSPLSIQA